MLQVGSAAGSATAQVFMCAPGDCSVLGMAIPAPRAQPYARNSHLIYINILCTEKRSLLTSSDFISLGKYMLFC